jgi:hypothetical protein
MLIAPFGAESMRRRLHAETLKAKTQVCHPSNTKNLQHEGHKVHEENGNLIGVIRTGGMVITACP